LFLVVSNVAVALCVATAILVGLVAYRGHRLDVESRDFVDSAVPAITARWSSDELLDLAAPELLANAQPAQMKAAFSTLSRQLGHLTEYEGATGDSLVTYTAGTGSTIKASYLARAKFEAAPASIWVMLVKRDGHWMISGFRVEPLPSDGTADRAT
jgi:hypothetical protein